MIMLGDIIRQSVLNVWKVLGSGHSETVYHNALKVELSSFLSIKNLSSGRIVPIEYNGVSVGHCVLDIDFLTLENVMVILELKAIKSIRQEEHTQIQRYRRLFSDVETIGYLINFGGDEPQVIEVCD